MTFVGATFGARRFFFTAFGGERRERRNSQVATFFFSERKVVYLEGSLNTQHMDLTPATRSDARFTISFSISVA
jgi:hypothetical protein